MIDAMIDIETLDTANTAIVLQVAVVTFDVDTFELQSQNSWHLNVDMQKESGRTWSTATLQWWLNQPNDTQQEVLLPAFGVQAHHPDIVMSELHTLLKDKDIRYVWSQGSFDFDIIENMMGLRELPWEFWQKRDCRTIESLAEMCGVDIAKLKESCRSGLTYHNAQDDCIAQIKKLENIYRCLNLRKK